MLDAVKNYLNLASGIPEVTRQRAVAAAKALASSGEATAEQVQNLADDLLVSSRNNRDAMLALVRYEVDRALNRLGLATADEVASLQRRVTTLEGTLAKTSGGAGTKAQKSSGRRAATKVATKTATKTATKRATKRATKAATRATTPTTAARTTVAPSPATKTAAAKSTAAKSTAAKSTAARSTAAKATAAKAIKAAPSAPSPAPAIKAAPSTPSPAPAKKSASSGPPSSS